MQKHIQLLGFLVAPFIFSSASAVASSTIDSPTGDSDFGGYFGLSAAFGEVTALDIATADVAGARLDAGILFGQGFSLDGRYQYLEDDGDGKLGDFRVMLNYKHELATGFAAFGGLGYGIQNLEITDGFDVDQDALLAGVGVEFRSSTFFTSLSYTHGFVTNSNGDNVFGSSGDLGEDDIGNLEFAVGVEFLPSLITTATIKTDLLQNNVISEDWIATIGLVYQF
jgi:hypothetical protein